jgi:tRNA A-37 threonylcarbamoyl transferase component Bud32
VNWQRDIVISSIDGQKVVIKKNKTIKNIHEYLLVFIITFLSLILLQPCSPIKTGKVILRNEGYTSRKELEKIGILTPKLIDINSEIIIEEFFEDGNLYGYLNNNNNLSIVQQVGSITRALHDNGACFIDNKAQNYLVRNAEIYRTDLGLIQYNATDFMKSLDIGIFLASLIDLENKKYKKIEKLFIAGYMRDIKSNQKIPFLSIIIRNIAALVLAANHNNLIMNLLAKSEIK